MNDAIELTIEPRNRPVGNGSVRRLLPFRERRMVGPFVFCDLFGSEDLTPGPGMDIDAHPHIGLSTLTYLLAGRAVHRDSTGAVQDIEAKAINWMTAGSGVTHTERSHPDDVGSMVPLLGIQAWVALPDGGEDVPPRFEHCPADEVPLSRRNGIELRVAVGTAFSEHAPVAGSSPLALVEVHVDDAVLAMPVEYPERAILALDDGLSIAGRRLPAGHLAVLSPGSRPELRGSGTAMLLAGEPVGDRHIWWNFVHSDPERIEEAKTAWTDQRFPLVPDDHEPWVPLPGS